MVCEYFPHTGQGARKGTSQEPMSGPKVPPEREGLQRQKPLRNGSFNMKIWLRGVGYQRKLNAHIKGQE